MGAGLFVVGTDTNVGKTYVACLVVRALVAQGLRVGVYKPVASGCRLVSGELVSDDAVALWEAAGKPGTLEAVCPQRFLAPLAPNLAARREGRIVDAELMRAGLADWRANSEIVIVEGAGGWLSPLSEEDYTADLAVEFGYRVLLVARNALGTLNHTLLTLASMESYRGGVPVAGIVLNRAKADPTDASVDDNPAELSRHVPRITIAELAPGATRVVPEINWHGAAML